jgi:hypothetical protein
LILFRNHFIERELYYKTKKGKKMHGHLKKELGVLRLSLSRQKKYKYYKKIMDKNYKLKEQGHILKYAQLRGLP